MSFEDTIRVADLKTRGIAAQPRYAAKSAPCPGQIIDVTEYMKPRVAEITGTLPAGIGQRSADVAHWRQNACTRFTGGRARPQHDASRDF